MQWLVKSFDTLTSQELYEILALRSEIFIVEQNVPYQDLDGKDLDAIHIFAKDNGTVVAAIRILKPGVSYPEASFGRVVVKLSREKAVQYNDSKRFGADGNKMECETSSDFGTGIFTEILRNFWI